MGAAADDRALSARERPASPPARLSARLGHGFADPGLLREALTHRSAARTGRPSNERLEFLGDRVLGLVVAEWVVARYPRESEGALGRRLAELVAEPALAGVAEAIGLGEHLLVSSGEGRAGVPSRPSVLADAMEAVIGALYADGGLEPARRFIRAAWTPMLDAQGAPPKDPKTRLQEYGLARGWALPDYALIGQDGPPHAPSFRIRVVMGGQAGEGTATNKRAAEREAAADLLSRLDGETR